MTYDDAKSDDLIDINLMFAELELTLGSCDPGSYLRALDHIREALTHLRRADAAKTWQGDELQHAVNCTY
ncbi:hypothetical protein M2322_004487 [Rhodoblastus acidophilus]|uniref:hypothetical protein n=1 Tax=Rhodoblastus acidophilus TaxID=1074 RepID=UPI002224075A|nr:hypothetical protein [Rhodoblastus acidophilus]MCW2318918.1 hypothetical protein [Rhodoblastus acidophilus]